MDDPASTSDSAEESAPAADEPTSDTEKDNNKKETADSDKKETADSDKKETADSDKKEATDSDNREAADSAGQDDAGDFKLSEGIVIPELTTNKVNVPDGSAFDFAYSLGVGFNLGNTFDAYDDYSGGDELGTETCWGNPLTTRDMIKDIHELGFDSIRIPVSWHNHVDEEFNISRVWLDRIDEVVGWALDEGLYVIINIHHDNHPEANCFYPDREHLDQSKRYISRIWSQLSDRFKDCDEHLIFESMNEPRLVGHANEWWIDPENEDCIEAIECINELNQVFVDTVRSSGDNNAKRYLMCPGYCASPEGATHRSFKLPYDPSDTEGTPGEGRLILSVHAYTPYSFALEYPGIDRFSASSSESTGDIDSFLTKLYMQYVTEGIPVVVGEFGARNKNDNLQSRVDYAAYYVRSVRVRGMSCLWWDNNLWSGDGELFGVYNRREPDKSNLDIVAALMAYK